MPTEITRDTENEQEGTIPVRLTVNVHDISNHIEVDTVEVSVSAGSVNEPSLDQLWTAWYNSRIRIYPGLPPVDSFPRYEDRVDEICDTMYEDYLAAQGTSTVGLTSNEVTEKIKENHVMDFNSCVFKDNGLQPPSPYSIQTARDQLPVFIAEICALPCEEVIRRYSLKTFLLYETTVREYINWWINKKLVSHFFLEDVDVERYDEDDEPYWDTQDLHGYEVENELEGDPEIEFLNDFRIRLNRKWPTMHTPSSYNGYNLTTEAFLKLYEKYYELEMYLRQTVSSLVHPFEVRGWLSDYDKGEYPYFKGDLELVAKIYEPEKDEEFVTFIKGKR